MGNKYDQQQNRNKGNNGYFYHGNEKALGFRVGFLYSLCFIIDILKNGFAYECCYNLDIIFPDFHIILVTASFPDILFDTLHIGIKIIQIFLNTF